ncbi:hypothetical protein, partial [Laspinema olomoucense]|uniref:hypothetical protein n=1 Tax=Laspinema olomoucense TaxID=3231600 RepID=UPI0021BA53B6
LCLYLRLSIGLSRVLACFFSTLTGLPLIPLQPLLKINNQTPNKANPRRSHFPHPTGDHNSAITQI